MNGNYIIINFKFFIRYISRSFRSKPDFMIVGTQKGGTSSMAFYLDQHPRIFIPKEKELNYFDLNYHRSINWYKHFFPLKFTKIIKRLVVGDATPDYMIYPFTAKRLYKFNPNLKIIILLRDPVSRAISHYRHNYVRKREPLSPEMAIEEENKRIHFDFIADGKCNRALIKNYSNYAYKKKGLYLEQINWILEFFPRDQLLIIDSESFFLEPEKYYTKAVKFLNLSPYPLKKPEVRNKGIASINFSDELKTQLKEYYKPYNQELFKFLNRHFP